LYDTVESRYVTLPQVAELVRRGEEVRIIDNTTKEDLTSVTLAQILYEEERKQSRALPLAALKDLIHTSGEKLMSSLREGPMGKLMGAKPGEGVAEGTPAAAPSEVPAREVPASSPVSGNNPVRDPAGGTSPGRLYEMFEHGRGSLQEWQHRVDERVRKVLESLSPSSQIEKLQAEVRRLTQRIDEIEEELGKKAPEKKDNEE